jgi:endonuclease YncB( thermonuclease family)
MPKASIKLPNGTSVAIEGSSEEVAKILALYGGASNASEASTSSQEKQTKSKSVTQKAKGTTTTKKHAGVKPDLPTIIQLIKTCDEAEVIETKILDKVARVNRILLPLYMVHEHLHNAYGLTSGEVSQILINIGTPVSVSNVSTALSGTASRYVNGDTVRKKGQAVRYKIIRRGVTYFKGILRDDK